MRETRPIHVALQPSKVTSQSVPLPAGTWRVQTRGPGPHEVQLTGGEDLGNQTVRLRRPGTVEIRITAGAKAFLLEGVEVLEQR